MNVGNVSFGANMDLVTASLISTAQKKGLNTENLINIIQRVPLDDTIKTNPAKDHLGNIIGIYSIGTGKPIKKFFSDRMIIEPRIVLNKKTNAYVWKVNKITQGLINKITKAIEKLNQ